MNNFQFKIFNFQMGIVLCLLFILSGPFFAHAETFVVEVDTGKENINALEGTLVLPASVSPGEIYTGNSVILIWVAKPALDAGQNTIKFSGITPGGFRGKYPLFSISGLDSEDLSEAIFSNVHAHRNDGSGTEARVAISLSQKAIEEDNAPPEPFIPVISSSPDIFDGEYFVSFVAQDKGTGVERYEYASTWLLAPDGNWARTESPQPLLFSERFKRVHIRAIDYEGNLREVSTAGPYRYYLPIFGVIILLCVLLLLRRSFHLRFS